MPVLMMQDRAHHAGTDLGFLALERVVPQNLERVVATQRLAQRRILGDTRLKLGLVQVKIIAALLAQRQVRARARA